MWWFLTKLCLFMPRFCIKILQKHAKKCVKADFNQSLGAAHSKCWSKYTTCDVILWKITILDKLFRYQCQILFIKL